MKKKIASALLVVLVIVGAIRVAVTQPRKPPELSGELSKRDVAEICSAVRRKSRPPILPNLSVQSIFAAPGVVFRRFSQPPPTIWKIERRTQVFAAVIGSLPKDESPRPYVFWGVFRGTNGWSFKMEQHY